MDGNLVSDQRLLRLELVRDLNSDGAMATAAPRPLEARGLPPRLAKFYSTINLMIRTYSLEDRKDTLQPNSRDKNIGQAKYLVQQ